MMPSVLKRLFCSLLAAPNDAQMDSGSGGSTTTTTPPPTTTSSTSSSGTSSPAPAPVGAQLPAQPTGTNIGGIVILGLAPVGGVLQPVRGPAVPVMPGDKVYIRPLAANTKTVNVGQYPAEVVYGPSDYVAVGDVEREFPVRNLAQIWIAAQLVGEGISINIRRGATQ